MNQGERPSRTLHLTARDLLVWTNRQTDGDGYDRLRSAFERLSGTRITTNIKADGEEITEGFGLINEWRIVRQTRSGQMSEIKITHSEWLVTMVEGRSDLTLHRTYRSEERGVGQERVDMFRAGWTQSPANKK